MKIDELLVEAEKYASIAVYGNGDRALFAQIAQACAQTAQAMILAKATLGDVDDVTRYFQVDTGN